MAGTKSDAPPILQPLPITMKFSRLAVTPLLAIALLSGSPNTWAVAKNAEELNAAAEKGDADAQYRLGQAHLRGIGVEKNLRQAYELILRAAEQGHAEALGGVGYFYATGTIVRKDLAEAVGWFRKGAEKGGAKAQLNLGKALAYGRGVPANEAEGLQWIERAAAQGLPHAFHEQGEFYYYGKLGHSQDYQEAFRHYLKAAEADYAGAQNMVGVMYLHGYGVQRNLVQAEAWFRKGAEQGDAKSQSGLGQLLGPDGPDTSKHVEALSWLMLAQRANEPMAKNILSEIARNTPPEKLAAARQRVAAFRPRPSAADLK